MGGPDEPGGDPGRREGLDEEQVRRIALVGGLLLVAILVLVFVIENSRSVPVSFVFFTADVSLIWVIVLSMVVGAGVGVAVKRLVRKRILKEDD